VSRLQTLKTLSDAPSLFVISNSDERAIRPPTPHQPSHCRVRYIDSEMQATRRLLAQRQPLIKFLGKRSTPASSSLPHPPISIAFLTPRTEVDHTPHQHPASPSELPQSFSSNKPSNSFAEYRQTAQQHGPLNTTNGIGGRTGHSLGSVEPEPGVFFDKSQLGARYQKLAWTAAEMEAIESGGASMWA
jgi:small subunit ribosomal protein YMR-31